MTRIRVLHCPTAVGGNPATLARAERAIGLESWAVSLEPPLFDYDVDEILWRSSGLKQPFQRLRLLVRALRSFDIVHFNFGASIFPAHNPPFAAGQTARASLAEIARAVYTRPLELRDLPLLKRAGKGIVVTYQGNDARQGDFSREKWDVSIASEVAPGYYYSEKDAAKRRRIEIFDRYADRIYALNPDLLWVLPGRAKFLPYANVDLQEVQPSAHPMRSIPLVIHAPSNRGAKGTNHVIAAVDRLRADGVRFDFRLIEGLTHEKALEEYRSADLVIDQVVSGWYGGLAVEAMAMARPVVAYTRASDLEFIPDDMRRELPVISASPDELAGALRKWLTSRRKELPSLGEAGRRYVERWHDPLKIAAGLKEQYEALLRTPQ